MEINDAVVALLALAQETRLRAFRLLVEAGPEGMAAGEIAAALDAAPPTLTFHLKELTHAGLVTSRREGRSIRYALRCETMRELLTFLSRDCCKGRPELCGGDAICRPAKTRTRKKTAATPHGRRR